MSNQKNISMLIEKAKSIKAPIAKKIPYIHEIHGDKRLDNYNWMRLSDEQKNDITPDLHTIQVIDYLNAENAYREELTAHMKKREDDLFEEIKARIKQTDMSVPYKENGYYYITRFEEAKEYPIYTRRMKSMESAEEVLLNVNELAVGHEYYEVGGMAISENNEILAYAVDTISRRQYDVYFTNLKTGEVYKDVINNTSGNIVWANDNQHVFYTIKDKSLREYKIMRHKLGTDVSNDVLVFHELDEMFRTFVYKTKSKKFLIIGSGATLSDEYRILEADNPKGEFKVFQKREPRLEHSIAHYKDNWYIRTNIDGAFNFKIMKCALEATAKENWVDQVAHSTEIYIEEFELFEKFMCIHLRKEGNTQILISPWSGASFYIPFKEESFTVDISTNPEFDTDLLRISYTSLTTPSSVFDFNVLTKEFTLLKEQEVLGTFKKEDYVSELKLVKAKDGTMIPLSIVYKNGFQVNGTQPLLLYGYGSYGYSMDPYFSSARLSLLDRGFAYAIAHIRGGQENGRMWYEHGKFLEKKNTFTDFIDCGQYLIDHKYCNPKQLYAMGGSAGGLLMGAVMNMAPDLWAGLIADVPFVDVVTTMLDESIPLTTGEFDEWGNPKNKEFYDYMKSYSPYDNVTTTQYPPLFITTGYHDSQVQYWEPAKWIAKLRDLKKDHHPLIMYCNMETGHGGASGRFRRLREVAMHYNFLLELSGK